MRPDDPTPRSVEDFEDFLWLVDELERDFLEECMSEPPGGHNHGRERGQGGGWTHAAAGPEEAEEGEAGAVERRRSGFRADQRPRDA